MSQRHTKKVFAGRHFPTSDKSQIAGLQDATAIGTAQSRFWHGNLKSRHVPWDVKAREQQADLINPGICCIPYERKATATERGWWKRMSLCANQQSTKELERQTQGNSTTDASKRTCLHQCQAVLRGKDLRRVSLHVHAGSAWCRKPRSTDSWNIDFQARIERYSETIPGSTPKTGGMSFACVQ